MSEVQVTVTENGPYKVVGEIDLIDADGNPVETKGATVFLCRACNEHREMWKKSNAWFYKRVPEYRSPSDTAATTSRSITPTQVAVAAKTSMSSLFNLVVTTRLAPFGETAT